MKVFNMAQKTKKTSSKIPPYGVSRSKGQTIFTALFPDAESVQIAGDFNNWQPQQMEKIDESGSWSIKLSLSPGIYRYRLVPDGRWQQDPFNEKTEPNPFGDLNSIVNIG